MKTRSMCRSIRTICICALTVSLVLACAATACAAFRQVAMVDEDGDGLWDPLVRHVRQTVPQSMQRMALRLVEDIQMFGTDRSGDPDRLTALMTQLFKDEQCLSTAFADAGRLVDDLFGLVQSSPNMSLPFTRNQALTLGTPMMISSDINVWRSMYCPPWFSSPPVLEPYRPERSPWLY